MIEAKPTLDLGYPTEPHGQIPTFANIEEEAESWDTHDFTDLLEESWPVQITIGPELAARVAPRRAQSSPTQRRGDASCGR